MIKQNKSNKNNNADSNNNNYTNKNSLLVEHNYETETGLELPLKYSVPVGGRCYEIKPWFQLSRLYFLDENNDIDKSELFVRKKVSGAKCSINGNNYEKKRN